ncbi:hypothetical protein F4558_000666 [Micromonospora profundi]|uniref:hypothetical protein n=1 Tax=Micromonospora profundi TaxID=1420889 RepID=UPI00143920B0|nr:hypothetical protein [Micromonospora profundi]NJC10840.1 hypothetical protein [Micromonospora profundi]
MPTSTDQSSSSERPNASGASSTAAFRSPQKVQVGKVHARKLVIVALDEHNVTVYDADSTTDLNRTKTKHQLTTSRR